MYVKIMGPENKGDDDSTKTFRLYSRVADIEFDRGEHAMDRTPQAYLHMEEGGSISCPVPGNVYVMNEHGKTIATFGVAYLRMLDEGPGQA